MKERTTSTDTLAIASALLIGIGTGGALALLFAPCSGEETRSRIKKGVADGKQRVEQASDDLRKRADELYAEGKNLVNESKNRVNGEMNRIGAAIEAGRRSYRTAAAPNSINSVEELEAAYAAEVNS